MKKIKDRLIVASVLISHGALLALSFILASEAYARPGVARPSSPSLPSSKSGDHLLWDAWYTLTVNNRVHYAYYNDHVELKDGRVFFQNRIWKKEEGYLNEEQLGAVAENTPDLGPLFFNFHSTYRATEINIDGSVKDKVLSVKVRKGDKDLPLIKKSIPSKLILSSFFPLWIGYRLESMKVGQTLSLMTVLEDNLEAAYSTVTGRVRLEKPDAYSLKTRTKRLSLDYHSVQSVWYVNEAGTPVRIDLPGQRVEKVSEEAAKSFLEE